MGLKLSGLHSEHHRFITVKVAALFEGTSIQYSIFIEGNLVYNFFSIDEHTIIMYHR